MSSGVGCGGRRSTRRTPLGRCAGSWGGGWADTRPPQSSCYGDHEPSQRKQMPTLGSKEQETDSPGLMRLLPPEAAPSWCALCCHRAVPSGGPLCDTRGLETVRPTRHPVYPSVTYRTRLSVRPLSPPWFPPKCAGALGWPAASPPPCPSPGIEQAAVAGVPGGRSPPRHR